MGLDDEMHKTKTVRRKKKNSTPFSMYADVESQCAEEKGDLKRKERSNSIVLWSCARATIAIAGNGMPAHKWTKWLSKSPRTEIVLPPPLLEKEVNTREQHVALN
jgi:hypothetical protein